MDIQYITRIVRFASIAIENASLFRQATTDRMTGLFSHHFFEKNLDEELERARRYKATFSLVMFDIDHFKKFNDTYGHLQGDRIIREIARLLVKSIRQVDFPARYGGEEFAVILPGGGREGSPRRGREAAQEGGRRTTFRASTAGSRCTSPSPWASRSSMPSRRTPPRRSSGRRTGPCTSPRNSGRNRVTVSKPRSS